MLRKRLSVGSGLGLSALLVIVVGVTVSVQAVSLLPTSKPLGGQVPPPADQVFNTKWAGYGVKGSNIHTIDFMSGSWAGFGDSFSCPKAGAGFPFSSEVIGVGLNTGGVGGRIDGGGTAVICVWGQPVYSAWVDEGTANTLQFLPQATITVHNNDTFWFNMTDGPGGGWFMVDNTTGQAAAGSWTNLLPATTHEAECIVGRGPALLGLPAAFNTIPTSGPHALTADVQFGEYYTKPFFGFYTGCTFGNIAADIVVGIGHAYPGYALDKFDLGGVNGIVPEPPVASPPALLPGDSWVVP
jgi:hypothetical protein